MCRSLLTPQPSAVLQTSPKELPFCPSSCGDAHMVQCFLQVVFLVSECGQLRKRRLLIISFLIFVNWFLKLVAGSDASALIRMASCGGTSAAFKMAWRSSRKAMVEVRGWRRVKKSKLGPSLRPTTTPSLPYLIPSTALRLACGTRQGRAGLLVEWEVCHINRK